MTFGEKLKETLEMKKMSQIELSRRTGIGSSDINHYIKGKTKKPQNRNIRKIEKVLEVDLGEYYSRKDNKELVNSEGVAFGNAIMKALQMKCMTQRQLARNIGIREGSISCIIIGKIIPKLETMWKIGTELSIPYKEFKIKEKVIKKTKPKPKQKTKVKKNLTPFDLKTPIVDNFKKSLLEHMRNKNISRDQLSQVGINNGQICWYLKGKIMPSLKNAIKMADYFDISLDELLGYKSSNKKYKSINNMAGKENETISSRLSNRMKQVNVNERELAILAKVSSEMIRNWIRGKTTNIHTKTLIKIATVLEISIDDLVGYQR